MFPFSSNAQRPPSPGYYPSSKFSSVNFNKAFSNLWGPQHQTLNGSSLTIWLDRSTGTLYNTWLIIISYVFLHAEFLFLFLFLFCHTLYNVRLIIKLLISLIYLFMNIGSGFKLLNSYRSGYFGAAIKLHPGYTAGVITSFYVRTRF